MNIQYTMHIAILSHITNVSLVITFHAILFGNVLSCVLSWARPLKTKCYYKLSCCSYNQTVCTTY